MGEAISDEEVDDEPMEHVEEPVKRTKPASQTNVKEPPKKRVRAEKKEVREDNDITESEDANIKP